jgi:hypothetical protein
VKERGGERKKGDTIHEMPFKNKPDFIRVMTERSLSPQPIHEVLQERGGEEIGTRRKEEQRKKKKTKGKRRRKKKKKEEEKRINKNIKNIYIKRKKKEKEGEKEGGKKKKKKKKKEWGYYSWNVVQEQTRFHTCNDREKPEPSTDRP